MPSFTPTFSECIHGRYLREKIGQEEEQRQKRGVEWREEYEKT